MGEPNCWPCEDMDGLVVRRLGGKFDFLFLVISAHRMPTKVRDLIVSLSLGKVGRCANSKKKTMASETGTMAADSVQMR